MNDYKTREEIPVLSAAASENSDITDPYLFPFSDNHSFYDLKIVLPAFPVRNIVMAHMPVILDIFLNPFYKGIIINPILIPVLNRLFYSMVCEFAASLRKNAASGSIFLWLVPSMILSASSF